MSLRLGLLICFCPTNFTVPISGSHLVCVSCLRELLCLLPCRMGNCDSFAQSNGGVWAFSHFPRFSAIFLSGKLVLPVSAVGAILGKHLLCFWFLLLLSKDLALKVCADLIFGRLTFEPVECCHDLFSPSTWAVLIWMNLVRDVECITECLSTSFRPTHVSFVSSKLRHTKNVQVLAISPGKQNCPIVKTHCIMLYCRNQI